MQNLAQMIRYWTQKSENFCITRLLAPVSRCLRKMLPMCHILIARVRNYPNCPNSGLILKKNWRNQGLLNYWCIRRHVMMLILILIVRDRDVWILNWHKLAQAIWIWLPTILSWCTSNNLFYRGRWSYFLTKMVLMSC